MQELAPFLALLLANLATNFGSQNSDLWDAVQLNTRSMTAIATARRVLATNSSTRMKLVVAYITPCCCFPYDYFVELVGEMSLMLRIEK